jgi:surface antigen
MVLGKLFLVLACTNVHANSWESSQSREPAISLGLIDTTVSIIKYYSLRLDKENSRYHSSAVYFALNNLETGEVAEWYNDRSGSKGVARIIATWTGNGDICRRVYSYVLERQKTFTYEDTACYNKNRNMWEFYR